MTGKKFDDIWAFVLCAQSSSDVPTVLLNRPHNSRQRTTVHNTLQGQTVTFIPVVLGLGLGMFHFHVPSIQDDNFAAAKSSLKIVIKRVDWGQIPPLKCYVTKSLFRMHSEMSLRQLCNL